MTKFKTQALIWLITCCFGMISTGGMAAEKLKETTIHLHKGQLLSLILPVPQPNQDALRREYFQRAFTLAKANGLRTEAQFKISKTVLGDAKPKTALLFSWPDAAAEKRVASDPQWPHIKALRQQAWTNLDIYTTELSENLAFTISPDKFYTLAVAWFSPQHPDAYDQYMENIRHQVEAVGGHFVLKMRSPSLESLQHHSKAPNQVTFVEWPNQKALLKLQSSDIYRANQKHFKSGVNRFEFYYLQAAVN